MTTILQDRLKRFLSPDVHLREGTGNGVNGDFDACAVQAADWLAGGTGQSDKPACVSAKIGRYVIGLNDSLLFKEHRDMLKPYVPRLVNTAGPSGEREVKRAYVLADYAVRVFAPIWLRADPEHRFDEHAAKLESLAPITDEATRVAAWAMANKARTDAATYADDATYATYAAAYATYATYAAAYATDAATYAADAAIYAADAATYATDDATYATYATDAATYATYAAYRKRVIKQHGDELRARALACLDAVLAV